MPKFKKNTSSFMMKKSPYKMDPKHKGTKKKTFLGGLLEGFSKIGKDIQKGFEVAKEKRKSIPSSFSIPKKPYRYTGLSAKQKIEERKRKKGY